MALFSDSERDLAQAISDLAFCNPFLPERVELEKKILGGDFAPLQAPVLARRAGTFGDAYTSEHANVARMTAVGGGLAEKLRARLAKGEEASEKDLLLYEDVILFFLFHRFRGDVDVFMSLDAEGASEPLAVSFYPEFEKVFTHFFEPGGRRLRSANDAEHVFACVFQLRRAFYHIFDNIIGGSMPTARLRASAWQSIFTRDMRRYRRVLHKKLGDVPCLVTGPSGTGKELVARAIGLSRYLPFNAKARKFPERFSAGFHALHLSALPATLVESELFGHRRGSFTGALQDRSGWLDVCSETGTVFLDEIGEIEHVIQVKLLRVLQFRVFQRLGETSDRTFRGKLIAATNRDLAEEIGKGNFREDLYYRLCADIVITPSLAEQLRDTPEALPGLALFVAERMVGPDESAQLAGEVTDWIKRGIGPDYPWPGNFRELEQCVRNVMIRGEYRPRRAVPRSVRDEIAAEAALGKLTAEEMLRRYCTAVYADAGSYQEAARRLDVDHRTVKSKIDPDLLERLRSAG